MMNCKQIQELLITDYGDDQAFGIVKLEVEQHLQECSCCQEFQKEYLEKTEFFFSGVQEESPPENMWAKIEKKIDQAQEGEGVVASTKSFSFFQVFLGRLSRVPRPAFIFSVVLILSLAVWGRLPQGGDRLGDQAKNNQLEYLVLLNDLDSLEENSVGFDSVIEQYFM